MEALGGRRAPANLLALGAIFLWSCLAWLGVKLATMPPFLLVGSALTLAGLLAMPTWRQWRVPPRVLALGIYGLFGFHFFLFAALRLAPPLEANLVNYLWPLLMVLLAPLALREARLSRGHVIGGVLGFAGAIVAIGHGRWTADEGVSTVAAHPHAVWGYLAALTSAFIWATYSLAGQRLRRDGTNFPTAALGACCLVSGLLALVCHGILEPAYRWSAEDVGPLAALAVGPMGAAFFLWDAALKSGDAPTIGTLAYLTPVLSTVILGLGAPAGFGWPIVVALALVVGGAVIGTRANSG